VTKSTFERKHPGVSVQVLHWKGLRECNVEVRFDNNLLLFNGRDEKRLLDKASQRVLALQARNVASTQGHRDANTGEVKPLQGHHLIKRSAGGTHAQDNLAGVSAETHSHQHELRKNKS
jgi:5-methylcytosine-specific restriction endonuclease McrA